MTTDAPIAVPAPASDPDSLPYWEGLKRHQILFQQCTDCARIQWPPMPACGTCQCTDLAQVESPGVGSVYSWIVVHRPFLPEFATEVPYTLATIDFDEGPRMVARIENPPPDFGGRVEPRFHDHPDWTELRFAISDSPTDSEGA
ncbi:MAG: OB-fold domain-containing protein [Nocardioides sp.]|uniref:Zn-ribbon domain-containing OB-fold protein n=1 Tax=Nocardioides sp. TaxID=35761 RepID=UPI0039E22F87